jgi:DNA-binding transcriptional MerR regulator
MSEASQELPAIPAKRYFTIGEVSELCGVKPYVLRYWEQEFTQLRPMKRRGNRRYYQHHEVLLIRRIRELLYDQGFTISGARNQLMEGGAQALAHAQSHGSPNLVGIPQFNGVLEDLHDGKDDALTEQAAHQPNRASGSDKKRIARESLTGEGGAVPVVGAALLSKVPSSEITVPAALPDRLTLQQIRSELKLLKEMLAP